MDMNYATVPMSVGETRRLYREPKFLYFISNQNSPKNYILYAIDEDMGCCILSVNDSFE